MKRPLVFFAAALTASLVFSFNVFGQAAPASEPAAAHSGPPSSTVASDQNYQPRLPYQTYYADYLALKHGKPVDLIFIGDSITEQWRWGTGITVWKKHFEDRALDFGLGADKTQHTIWRLKNFDLKEWSPKVAIILIGTNNAGDTPEEIAAGVKAVIDTTKEKFPGIKAVVLSILPNARATEKMAVANTLIAPLADGKTVFYLDLASKFTPVEGGNWLGLGRDKLHLTAEGYEMWAAELETLLPRLLAK
jgi:lysophospholipase L1-like esterase